MKTLLQALKQETEAGRPAVLAVIISGKGSSPRKIGAAMLCGAEGRISGTIGGGISEHLACEEAKTLIRERRSVVRDYRLHPNSEADIGARCGGEVQVYLRYIRELSEAKEGSARIMSGALRSFTENAAWLLLDLTEDDEGRAAILHLDASGIPYLESSYGTGFPALAGFAGHKPLFLEIGGKGWFSLPLFSPGFVYIAGGGHISQMLCPVLTRLGFRCVIFDNRPDYASRDLFPSAARVINANYDMLAEELTITNYDYIIAVTSGHTGDFKTAAFALGTGARYIGIIGSKQKLAFVNERLRGEGFSNDVINAPRVHAPIGIPIHSETPEEVAISIAAELIKVRAE